MSEKLDEIEFKKFIKRRDVVIADPGITTRAILTKAISELGTQAQFIHTVATYDEAEQAIAQYKPQIVITDFDLGSESGLNLLQAQRESNPDDKETLFVIITSNASQTAVAQAAEEDVDTYILKPFTMESLRNMLVKALMMKINPTDYVRTIERGKKVLFEGDPQGAIAVFDAAIILDPKPALAYFYRAQAQLMQKALEAAEGDYKSGLACNDIHYKCLVGLFDLLMTQKRETEAYEVVKKIATYFPAHPRRLTQVLKLTISLKKVDDLLEYYEAFCKLTRRDDQLVLHMCAALVVSGKHFLKNGDREKGLSLLNKAAVSSAGNSKILREVIFAYAECKEYDEARAVLKRFTDDEIESPHYAASDIVIKEGLIPPMEVIKEIRVWLDDRKVMEPYLFETIIRRLIDRNSFALAEDFYYRAVKVFEDEKFTDPRGKK